MPKIGTRPSAGACVLNGVGDGRGIARPVREEDAIRLHSQDSLSRRARRHDRHAEATRCEQAQLIVPDPEVCMPRYARAACGGSAMPMYHCRSTEFFPDICALQLTALASVQILHARPGGARLCDQRGALFSCPRHARSHHASRHACASAALARASPRH